MRHYQAPRPALFTADVAMLGHKLLVVGPHVAPNRRPTLAAAELDMRTLRWSDVSVARAGSGGVNPVTGSDPSCHVPVQGGVRVVAFHGALMVYGEVGHCREDGG